MDELIFQPAYELAEAIRRKQVSSVEVVEAQLFDRANAQSSSENITKHQDAC